MPSRSSSALAIGLLMSLAVSDPAQSDPVPETRTVVIERFSFFPAEISAPVGARIIFLNRDQAPHAIVGERTNGEMFRSPENIEEDETYGVELTTPGEIEFHCGLHSAMKGRITVIK